jgi:hypothetical protein
MPTATDLVTDLPADFEVFGQAVATSLADLLGGTTGQILAKASNTNMDFTWITNDVGDITAVTASSPLTGGGTSGAITVGIQDATTSVKGAVQLSDSTSTTSSILAATPTAVKSAFDLATTANTNSNNITMVQQYTATESVLKNIPSRVPAAEQLLKQAVYWIDAAQSDNSDQVLDNQGWGAPALTTQLGSSASADSNDPKFLDFDGTNYVYLPGVASNNLSIPDATNLDITGDIDLRVEVALDDWTPAAENTLIAKWVPAGSEQSFVFNVNPTTGYLRLVWYTAAGATLVKTSTAAPTIADGNSLWVRATLDVDNGASGNDVKFFTSTDGITYTQLGSTITTAGTTDIKSSTAIVQIGQYSSGELLTGKVSRAQIFNGIAGTKVLDVDTSVIGSGSATSFSALTGQTVTINRSTSGKKTAVVTAPIWLLGTDDYLTVANNDLLNFGATESLTLLVCYRQWNTQGSFTPIFGKQLNRTQPGYGFEDWSTTGGMSFNITDTNNVNVANAKTGTYTIGGVTVLTGVRDVAADNTIYYNGAIAAGTAVTDTTTTSLTNTQPLMLGYNPNTGTGKDIELMAAAVFRRALTASEIATISNYYQARIGA